MSQGRPSGKRQPHYSTEVKDLAVARMRAGEKATAIVAEMGCSLAQLYRWRDQWEKHGGQWPEPWARDRSSGPPRAGGGAAREAALERLVGQQQAELDFLREALRLLKQVRPGNAEP